MCNVIQKLQYHLRDNGGDANISMLILVVIAFVVGGILVGLFMTAMQDGGTVDRGAGSAIEQAFNW